MVHQGLEIGGDRVVHVAELLTNQRSQNTGNSEELPAQQNDWYQGE